MRLNSILLSVVLTLGASGVAISQQPTQQPTPQSKPEVYLAPNAPKDKPVDAKGTEADQLEEAIKPYIEKAKNTYPQAKARFLSGLPPRHTFFITTRLHDA